MALYEQDFFQWTQEQAALLKAGALSQLDVANLIEEIESMGRSEKRELSHRLEELIAHLLKWDFQPERRSRSWELTINEQRIRIKKHLRENPSLKHAIKECIDDSFELAVIQAIRETKLDNSVFPKTCPYRFEQIMGEPQ